MDDRRGWRAGWADVAHVGGHSRDGEGDGSARKPCATVSALSIDFEFSRAMARAWTEVGVVNSP